MAGRLTVHVLGIAARDRTLAGGLICLDTCFADPAAITLPFTDSNGEWIEWEVTFTVPQSGSYYLTVYDPENQRETK